MGIMLNPYGEPRRGLLDFFPGATHAIVYNHDVFGEHYEGDRTEDQAAKNPGFNTNYANLVHNDLNDNSGRVRGRELFVFPCCLLLRSFLQVWAGSRSHLLMLEVGVPTKTAADRDLRRSLEVYGRAVRNKGPKSTVRELGSRALSHSRGYPRPQ